MTGPSARGHVPRLVGKAPVMPENRRDLGSSGDGASHQGRDAARAFNKGANASKSPRDPLTQQRVRLRDAGFAPIPVSGKIPAVSEWQQKTGVPDDEMETWEPHKGTGLLTRLMPALDVDIYNPEAAKAVEELVRKRFEGRGKVLVRIGNEPKFAIPFRTSTPFKKITATLIPPEDDLTGPCLMRDGSPRPMDQRIELMCDGQQLVAFGVHPETRKPYKWTGGEPGEIRHDELPEITEGEARDLVEDVAQLLCDKFGYTRKQSATRPEGATRAPNEKLAADDITELAAAVEAIPNNIPGWEDWNRVMMAIWAATGGNEEGFEIADRWCAKWEGYDANETRRRWKAISKSPPNRIGAGTIYHMADEASPGWRRRYETEKITKILANRKEEKEAADDPTAKTCISATPFNWIDPRNILAKAVAVPAALHSEVRVGYDLDRRRREKLASDRRSAGDGERQAASRCLAPAEVARLVLERRRPRGRAAAQVHRWRNTP
jgi:Primase C terminal 2 (PriCT-2)/Bifunctional DNA primase/polymerase, N-terminal